MRILLLNTYDCRTGSARAAYRLHQGLRKIKVDSRMLVQVKQGDDPAVIGSSDKSGIEQAKTGLRQTLNKLPLKFYSNREKSSYSLQWLPNTIDSKVKEIAPDLINLHWITGGFLQVETIAKFNKPIIWTLHDMWAFTGGCHYNLDCDRYTNSCGACPQLHSKKNWDLSRWVWQRKAKAWQKLDLTIVTPSKWLAECAKSSSLFQNSTVKVIPNGLDIHKYQPSDKQLARKLWELPQDKQIILFGAISATSDPRKGFLLLQAALQHLRQWRSPADIELVVFGSSRPAQPIDLGFKVHYLGYLHDDISLAMVYSAADVTVVPSTQEAFGQTASESLACGTPVVAFNATGLQDIIGDRQNGYLAQPYQIDDLARGIVWVLEDKERYQKLALRARKKAEQEFSLETSARRYLSLYEDILPVAV